MLFNVLNFFNIWYAHFFAKTTFECVSLQYFCSIFELKMWFFPFTDFLFDFFNFVVPIKKLNFNNIKLSISLSLSLYLSLSISLHLSLFFSNTCSRSFSLSTSLSLCFLVCVCLQDSQMSFFSVREIHLHAIRCFFWFCLLKIGFEIVREI